MYDYNESPFDDQTYEIKQNGSWIVGITCDPGAIGEQKVQQIVTALNAWQEIQQLIQEYGDADLSNNGLVQNVLWIHQKYGVKD